MPIVLDGTTGITNPAGSASAPSISTAGDTNTGMFFPAADTIAFAEGGVESMRIDSSGNVGVGVTPSAWYTATAWKALQISTGGAAFTGNESTARIFFNAYVDSTGNSKYTNNGVATQYAQTSGQHAFYTASSGTAGNAITFTETMRINTNGNLALQGGTTTATGVGITFPATQSASTDANCLDDYEEGTWTPTWSVSGGTITANGWTSGKYTKVGSTVYLWGYISYNSHTGSPSGQLSITNFPFAAGGGFGQSSTFSGGLTISAGGLWASGMPSFADIKPASNSGLLQYYGATGGVATTFANMTQNGNYSQFIFFGQYTV